MSSGNHKVILLFFSQMLQSRRKKILDLYARACNVTEGKAGLLSILWRNLTLTLTFYELHMKDV